MFSLQVTSLLYVRGFMMMSLLLMAILENCFILCQKVKIFRWYQDLSFLQNFLEILRKEKHLLILKTLKIS